MERGVVQLEERPVARAQEGHSVDGRGMSITWIGLGLGLGLGLELGSRLGLRPELEI